VVTVQVRENNCRNKWRRAHGAHEAHDDATASIDNDVLPTGLHEGGWASARSTREWAAGTEQGDLHEKNLTLIVAEKFEHGLFHPMYQRPFGLNISRIIGSK
jgi:hypothetical protein